MSDSSENSTKQIPPTLQKPTKSHVGNDVPSPKSSANPSAYREHRFLWRLVLLLFAIAGVLAVYLFAEPRVMAAFDPARRARISVERVRKAEKVVLERLATIKERFEEDQLDKVSVLVNSADDFHKSTAGFREMGNWLLQERPQVEADMDAYLSAMGSAIPRLDAASQQNVKFAQEFAEDHEFRKHYLSIARDYTEAADYFRRQIGKVRSQRQQLVKDMEYTERVLVFLDRFELLVDVLSTTNSEQAQRIEQYFHTLASFKLHFEEMMALLASVEVDAS